MIWQCVKQSCGVVICETTIFITCIYIYQVIVQYEKYGTSDRVVYFAPLDLSYISTYILFVLNCELQY